MKAGSKTGSLQRYSGIQIALHWSIALIIISMVPVGLVMTRLDPSNLTNLLYELHKSFGLIVFGLAVIRIGARFALGAPALEPDMPRWQVMAARVSHGALYLLIILVPLTGWAATSACCAPVNLFWTIPLTLPIGGGFDTAGPIFLLHNIFTMAMVALIFVHAAAALYHHYSMKDDTLRKMMPGERR
ncbi:MAG: cytochrome b [Salinarimonas sp.]|nr:cytochrome b [Salinarimonas sp.]